MDFPKITFPLKHKTISEIFEAGIQSILPETLFKEISFENHILKIGRFSQKIEKRLFVIGAGKASGKMAIAISNIIGSKNICAGYINCPESGKIGNLILNKAGHPLPDTGGQRGAEKIISLKEEYAIGNGDVILCLLSGGGSAMLPLPADGISLQDKIETTKQLLMSGANINEINTVRKHLSKIKGGRLAEHFSPAKVITLIISDVIGNNLEVIASGPSFADPTTFKDAVSVLKRYGLERSVPNSVFGLLNEGACGRRDETPKQIKNSVNLILGDNSAALDSMAKRASILGFNSYIFDEPVSGESSEAAARVLEIVKKRLRQGIYKKPCAIVAGGETTVTIKGPYGMGGRNQEYALSSLLHLSEDSSIITASMASDGSDFMEGVAGGVADSSTLVNISKEDLVRSLKNHDSYTILKKIDALIYSERTGTNVCDLFVYLTK